MRNNLQNVFDVCNPFLQKKSVFGGHMAGNHRYSMGAVRAQESRTLANFHKKGFLSLKSKLSRPEKGVITKGVFSPEESLESLESLNSLESLDNGGILLYFPQSGGSLESLESLENGLF